ncbi:WD40-repeat-containing domain protein [Lasiosphaeria hispida]|uniref:Mitochondrial division protein 1 n=1 Tax=Lasiosphaeria hispida TaxID=260671 RepID=A0AAJ0H778_9PEZI|nr:WD40-repeat-containing domain protein [Lasiosphaeria hispida]
METLLDSSLAAASRSCMAAFNHLESGLGVSTNEYKKLMPLAAMQNQRDRFKIWSGNLGALQQGRSSLDFRLRDSSLMRTTILKLLDQLKDTIARSNEVVWGLRPPLEEQFSSDADLMWEDDSSDDSSIDGKDGQGGENQVNIRTELGQNMSEIIHILSDLFRLSFKIRNPATRSTTQSALKALLHKEMIQLDEATSIDLLASYASFDHGHVQESFRELRRSVRGGAEASQPANPAEFGATPASPARPNTGSAEVEDGATGHHLIERWSKSITNRRRYFAYWRKHAQKLARDEGETVEDQPLPRQLNSLLADANTIQAATPINSLSQLTAVPSIAGKTILSGTEGTVYDRKLDADIDTQSMISYTSTAYSTGGSMADLPPPPSTKPTQSEFTCPYCWVVCPVRHAKGKHWREHVLQDLQPYMCTYPDCLEVDTMYANRAAWLDHEAQAHRKVWRCFEHSDHFQSKKALIGHLETVHQNLAKAQIQAMADLGYASRQDDRTMCPFCLLEGPFQNGLVNHMASHMEMLARFAVLRSTGTEDDGSSCKSSSGSAQGGQSIDSLRSVILDFSEQKGAETEVEDDVRPITLIGHKLEVQSVAFLGDGSRLASGSSDQTIKIWDTITGECVRTLTGHGNYVYSVAFSGDGSRLASGSEDQTIKIWDTITGECVRTLTDHGNSVYSVAFSGDGSRLASGSEDQTIKIWDTITGECVRTLTGHGNYVLSVAFSGDGSRLASDSEDKTIKIWDTITGECVRTLTGHGNSVYSVAFSGDGSRLASGSLDETIKIWDTITGECVRTLTGHGDSVYSVAFSGDGSRLASGSEDETIKIWDTITGECVRTLTGHGDSVYSVAFSEDGSRLASGSADKTIKIWDVAKLKSR